jgi:asparagine synthase (glutamine-hydrolysing)
VLTGTILGSAQTPMCGIVGIVSSRPCPDRGTLACMRDTMAHRGPDDRGEWWSADGRVGFGHRRLAIIDLSAGGHQPMVDEAGPLAITFNGEIYNFLEIRAELERDGRQFRTSSDTEVVLAAYRKWGEECLRHLNGMFAFALFDGARRRLLLARDRAGEKPLFVYRASGKFMFASELKALMKAPGFPRVLDRQSLEHYLAYGYIPGSLCLLKGVNKLPQGHALSLDVDSLEERTWTYWSLPRAGNAGSEDAETLVSELEELLLDSVRLRLISDVPVGIMLSGGLDSSLVTAAAARASGSRIRTFTISFPGGGEFDETGYARIVARHFGTDHTELPAESATVDLLPRLAAQYDEPISDSSMVPTFLVSRLIRQKATVALGGDGGDELFGGYPWHSLVLQQALAQKFLSRPLCAVAGGIAAVLPIGSPGRNFLAGFGQSGPCLGVRFNTFFDAQARRGLLLPGETSADKADRPAALKASLTDPSATPLQRMTSMDFQTYLVDDILVKVDRASMLTSLEVRAPWLDPRIIEFAFERVPDRLRATPRDKKILPRLLGERWLPRELDLKRKRGFSIPFKLWAGGEWGRFMESVLLDCQAGLFSGKYISSLMDGERNRRQNFHRLFLLTMLELWRREYNVQLESS